MNSAASSFNNMPSQWQSFHAVRQANGLDPLLMRTCDRTEPNRNVLSETNNLNKQQQVDGNETVRTHHTSTANKPTTKKNLLRIKRQ